MVSIIADGSGGPGFVSTSLLFFSFELLFNDQPRKERKLFISYVRVAV